MILRGGMGKAHSPSSPHPPLPGLSADQEQAGSPNALFWGRWGRQVAWRSHLVQNADCDPPQGQTCSRQCRYSWCDPCPSYSRTSPGRSPSNLECAPQTFQTLSFAMAPDICRPLCMGHCALLAPFRPPKSLCTAPTLKMSNHSLQLSPDHPQSLSPCLPAILTAFTTL